MSTMTGDRRGSIAIVMALSMAALVGAVGLGVDLARLWLVQTRLQAAVDAGVLVAAREMGAASANNDATALFWADFGRVDRKTGEGFLSAKADAPKFVTVDADTVRMTADAIVPMTLMAALGVGAKPVHVEASARRAVMGVELALVLDITGSMAGEDIKSLRSSAANLVNILFGSSPKPPPNLWVSVVPYTASVNLGWDQVAGRYRTEWLAPGKLNPSDYAPGAWAGCVEARVSPEDGTDKKPSDAPFTPFLWKSTLNKYFNGQTVVKGDNDWSPTDPAHKITEQNQAALPDNTAVGPNLSCPASPVLPLTDDKAAALQTISGLQATFRGGTLTNLGLQAGWFTLSPTWRGLWGKEKLPLNYNTPNMRKVIVMMTDGENNWYDWPDGAPGQASPNTYTPNPGPDADYTAYGRLSEKRLGASIKTITDARVEIDARVAKLCTNIKKAGITIYTITFGVNSTDAQKLWRDCASKPDNYFDSPTQAALNSAFQQIGTQLANLRLTQ